MTSSMSKVCGRSSCGTCGLQQMSEILINKYTASSSRSKVLYWFWMVSTSLRNRILVASDPQYVEGQLHLLCQKYKSLYMSGHWVSDAQKEWRQQVYLS